MFLKEVFFKHFNQLEHSSGISFKKALIAVSGGPDSMALLALMMEIRVHKALELAVAHYHHGLRGEAADHDLEFVRNYCQKHNIPFYFEIGNVSQNAKENKWSIEEAGRIKRYEFLTGLAKKLDSSIVLTGHHKDDQSETVLQRILDGSGISGLRGIHPIVEDHGCFIIRPMLIFSRSEIMDYLQKNNFSYCIDETNENEKFSRNKLRLRIIPFLKREWNKEVQQSFLRLSDIASLEDDYLEKEVNSFLNQHAIKQKTKLILNRKSFSLLHNAIKRRVVRSIMKQFQGEVDYESIENVCYEIAKNDFGYFISLKNRYFLYLEKDFVCWSISEQEYLSLEKEFMIYPDQGFYFDSTVSGKVMLSTKDQLASQPWLKNEKTRFTGLGPWRFEEYLAYDSCPNSIYLKFRIPNLFYKPIGCNYDRTLKECWIDDKVPRFLRGKIPILYFNKKIVWPVGLKISDEFKVQGNVKKILHISLVISVC